MNYIELINHFWQIRRKTRLTACEADLYYFLMQESNLRDWENPFECSNGLICSTIGTTEKTLIGVRKRLQEKGLITYKSGQRKTKSPVYTLLYSSTESKSKHEKANVAMTSAPKTNKARQQSEPAKLVYPFTSANFMHKWQMLMQCPKWKNKKESALQLALDRLRDFEEPFVIELIEQAIIGGWQGLIYSDTKAKYSQWLRQRQQGKLNFTNHYNTKAYEQF